MRPNIGTERGLTIPRINGLIRAATERRRRNLLDLGYVMAAAGSEKPAEALGRMARGGEVEDDALPENGEGDFDNTDEHWRTAWSAGEAT